METMKLKLCKKYSKKKKLSKKLKKQYPDLEIKICSCIGMCKSCKLSPVGKLKNEKVKKKSIKKFVSSIEKLYY
jgi:hypothetical protein